MPGLPGNTNPLEGPIDVITLGGFREVVIRCNGDEVVEFIRVGFVLAIPLIVGFALLDQGLPILLLDQKELLQMG